MSGLAGGQALRGIDFRPANGGLYSVSSDNRLYTVNPNTGLAPALGAPSQFTLNGSALKTNFAIAYCAVRLGSETHRIVREFQIINAA